MEKKTQIAEIVWRDSNIYITQCNREDDFKIEVINSFGKIIQENEEKIVLAGDLIGEEVRRVIVIPKENIIKVFNH